MNKYNQLTKLPHQWVMCDWPHKIHNFSAYILHCVLLQCQKMLALEFGIQLGNFCRLSNVLNDHVELIQRE